MTGLLPNARYERKFVAKGISLPEILSLVRRHPGGFREAYPARVVNNIYLDTPGLEDYHDHVNGTANRAKTRVRWYGSPAGRVERPVLERKLKRGTVSGKITHALPPIFLNGDGLEPALKSAFDGPDLSELQKLILWQRQPALVNRYRRHYFLSGDGLFRLTIDSELEFANPQPNKPRRGSQLLVIELKFSPQHADAAQFVANSFPFRIARCSKYILGLHSL